MENKPDIQKEFISKEEKTKETINIPKKTLNEEIDKKPKKKKFKPKPVAMQLSPEQDLGLNIDANISESKQGKY